MNLNRKRAIKHFFAKVRVIEQVNWNISYIKRLRSPIQVKFQDNHFYWEISS